MKQVLETNSQLNEKIQREHSARRALERTLMTREDYESSMKQKQQDEGFDEEFYSLDWGRKVSIMSEYSLFLVITVYCS